MLSYERRPVGVIETDKSGLPLLNPAVPVSGTKPQALIYRQGHPAAQIANPFQLREVTVQQLPVGDPMTFNVGALD